MGTRSNRLAEAVLTSTHNLCFEQKYENYQTFLSENFQFLEVKFCIYLYRRVFVMASVFCIGWNYVRIDSLTLNILDNIVITGLQINTRGVSSQYERD